MGFRERIKMFMAGRNGVDALFYFCFIVYFVIFGLNRIFRSPWLYYGDFALLRRFYHFDLRYVPSVIQKPGKQA